MRCRISGSFGAHEIPLLAMLFYLFRDVAPSAFAGPGSGMKLYDLFVQRATRETTSGGEFGWGGTSVKE